jgi:DNA (cytosine-5)-methyltransferase 3A
LTNELEVVSLFDGISCGRAALEQAGYAVSYCAAYEIDKYAKSISRYNYPDIEQFGDVMDADFRKFSNIDLLIGGSPCQTFSIAKNGRDTEKGGFGWILFMKYVEALKTISPRYFMYENVASMHKNIREYISDEVGCEPIMINSALVSAQQRKRLYWTNIEGITQPEDRGILLKDILESGLSFNDKSYCITSTYAGATFEQTIKKRKRTTIAEPIALADKSQTILSTPHKEKALSMVKRQKTGFFVAHSLEGDGGDNADTGIAEVGAALRTRADENGKFKRLEVRHDGKLNALTSVQTDSVVCTPVRIGKGGKGERIYSVRDKMVSITTSDSGSGTTTCLYKIDLPDGDYTIRKLTPIEAERCQGLADNYTALGIDDKGNQVNISNTQRYKCLGNGWQVATVAHIFSFMDWS